MALSFRTSNPTKLLKSFNARIDQEEREGKITTWERNAKGEYTHKASDWYRKAWFRATVIEPVKSVNGEKDVPGELRFGIHPPPNGTVEPKTYSYYHGHLTETFLNHFQDLFTFAISSSKPFRKKT
jgi:hypothetical protein